LTKINDGYARTPLPAALLDSLLMPLALFIGDLPLTPSVNRFDRKLLLSTGLGALK
jgi:hypothetical protein